MSWFRKKAPKIECAATAEIPLTNWEDRQAKWLEDAKKQSEAIAKRLERELEDAKADDWRECERAHSFDPGVWVVASKVGDFLERGDISVPTRHIEAIEITRTGGAPYVHWVPIASSLYCPMPQHGYVVSGDAEITIRMASGREHRITINRHCVEMLHEALIEAWRKAA